MDAREWHFWHKIAALEDNIAVQAACVIRGGCVLVGNKGRKAAGLIVHICRID